MTLPDFLSFATKLDPIVPLELKAVEGLGQTGGTRKERGWGCRCGHLGAAGTPTQPLPPAALGFALEQGCSGVVRK